MENCKLHERLITLLKSSHTTQKQLSDILGVDRTVISKYCNNKRLPPIQHLIKISQHFNVSCDWLLGNETSTNPINYDALVKREKAELVKKITLFLDTLNK